MQESSPIMIYPPFPKRRLPNGYIRYTILPIQNAMDCYRKRQMAELQRKAGMQSAIAKAEKLGVHFVPAAEQPA